MKKIVILLLFISLLSSCVSTKIVPLQKNDSVSIKNKTLKIIHDNKPDFAAMTYGNIMISMFTGGILGVIIMTRDGNKIIDDNSVGDPAVMILASVADKLKKDYQIRIVDELATRDTNVSAEKISKRYEGSSDYVLDIRTISWFVSYLPMRVSDYRLVYSSKLRVIDVRSSKVVAEGFCARIPDGKNPEEIYSYDKILANKAENLKAELVKAANYCSDLFKEKVFPKDP